MRVYLAGSITGATPKDAIEWRDYAKTKLSRHGIMSYSPMRGKETFGSVLDNGTLIEVDSESKLSGPENTTRAIMTRDYLDCTKADALLVNLLNTPNISGGTIAELAWAYHLRIPTIVMCDPNSYYCRHPMVSEMITYRVDTIDQGIDIVVSVLLP